MKNTLRQVKLLTGKYTGKIGYFICWTTSHHLSDKKRAQIRVQTGLGWKTVLVNSGNFKEVE